MRQLSRISFRDVLYLIFRDKNRIFVTILIAFLGASIWLSFQSSIYVAETRVLVRIGKEKMSGLESMNTPAFNILFQERPPDIHNGLELLRDPALSYAVYQRLKNYLQPTPIPDGGLAYLKYIILNGYASIKDTLSQPLYWFGFLKKLTKEEGMIKALTSSLRSEVLEDTDVIKITFAWPDAQFSALAANTFAEELLAKYIDVHGAQDSGRFYAKQLNQQHERVAEAEAALQEFRDHQDITNLQWQKDTVLRELADGNIKLGEIELRLTELRSVSESVASSYKNGDEWIPTPEIRQRQSLDLSSLDRQYFELTARRAQLAATQQVESPDLQQLQQRIMQVREQKFDSLHRFFDVATRTTIVERDTLQKQAAIKRSRLDQLNTQTGPYTHLERERNAAEQNLVAYQKKAEELRVSDLLSNLKFSGLRIVSDARVPTEPAAPRRFLILGLAIGIGLLLALSHSAVTEYFNHRFRDAQDVNQILGRPVLMSIPLVNRSFARGFDEGIR
jgi:uncharacterized protein involved in exopolysaccharide biosynthesis